MSDAKHTEGVAMDPAMWTIYDVRWTFLTRLCGSVPADPEIVAAWLKARRPAARPPGGKSIDEIQEEVLATLAEGEEAPPSINTFQRVDGVCVIRAATIRAHLKDCARVLSAQYVGSIQGERSFSTRVINGVYPDPATYWVPILRPDGTPVSKHDGEQDRPIHVRGPRGEQLNALKRYEYIQPARLDFRLGVLTAKGARQRKNPQTNQLESASLPSVSRADLETVMRYGGVHGYGGERGDGEGRYTFTLTQEA